MSVKAWMSWEGGVDLAALTQAGMPPQNLLVHCARTVHTPVGSAPAGIVLIPGPSGTPLVYGFVCRDPALGAWIGPHVFAGTPFEHAPVVDGEIEVRIDASRSAAVTVRAAGHVVEVALSQLGPLVAAHRAPGAMPFHDASLEAPAGKAVLKVDGREIALMLPPAGPGGGPPAVWSPAGIYAR